MSGTVDHSKYHQPINGKMAAGGMESRCGWWEQVWISVGSRVDGGGEGGTASVGHLSPEGKRDTWKRGAGEVALLFCFC